jgi:hypothetical protein
MRNNLLPSSLSIARTCTRCTISHLLRGRQDQTRAASSILESGAGRKFEAAVLDQPRFGRRFA